MNTYAELKKVIREYESDTFYGADLSDEQSTIIADRLIENLINNLDGATLSVIYDENFEEDNDE